MTVKTKNGRKSELKSQPNKPCTCFDDLPKDVREAIESVTAWCEVSQIADDHQARVDRAIYYQNEIQC